MKTIAETPMMRNAPALEVYPPAFEESPAYRESWSMRLQPCRQFCSSCCQCTLRRCRHHHLGLWPALIAVGLMGIIFGIFFGTVYPTVLARENYESTTCTSLGLSVVTTRCCDIHDCSCSECPLFGTTANCGSLVQQSLNNSICCGGSQCCRTQCETCCSTICTGSGKDLKCSWICSDCNCRCTSSVNHQTCSFVCGECSAFDLFYSVGATGLQLHNQNLRCGLNDDACVFHIMQQFKVNQTWPCWYDRRDFSQVRFDGIPEYNKGTLAAFIIFCIFFFFLLVVWTFLCIRHQ